MEKLTFMYIILIAAAAVPVLICVIKMARVKNFKHRAVKVPATIMKVEERIGLKGGRYYLVTLEYRLAETSQIWHVRAIQSRKQEVSEVIPLWYLPTNPAKYSIDNGKRYPMGIILTTSFFLLIVWVCFVLSNAR